LSNNQARRCEISFVNVKKKFKKKIKKIIILDIFSNWDKFEPEPNVINNSRIF